MLSFLITSGALEKLECRQPSLNPLAGTTMTTVPGTGLTNPRLVVVSKKGPTKTPTTTATAPYRPSLDNVKFLLRQKPPEAEVRLVPLEQILESENRWPRTYLKSGKRRRPAQGEDDDVLFDREVKKQPT